MQVKVCSNKQALSVEKPRPNLIEIIQLIFMHVKMTTHNGN